MQGNFYFINLIPSSILLRFYYLLIPSSMKKNIQIFFADDSTIFRKIILRELLSYDIFCSGEASNGKDLLKLLSKKQPDVVLLDLEMPVMDGNETLEIIQEKYPETKVIIVSSYDNAALLEDYYSRGVRAYLSKHEIANAIKDLADVISKVHRGEIFYRTVPDTPMVKHYSLRQKEIISIICHGKTNKEIAHELGILERSVEKQRQKIYEKTNAEGTVSFLRYAFKNGLDLLGVKRHLQS